MKLNDLAAPRPTKQIAKVFESYFGTNIKFESLNRSQTRNLLTRVQGLLKEHRSTSSRHTSEQNPSYLKLVMLEQALAQRVKENMPPVAAQQPAAAGQPKPAVAGAAAKDPKLAAALKKSQVVDKNTGRVDMRYNPMSVDEDYFIPVRGGESGTKIDTLSGGTNAAAIEDVQYIQKKLFAALKIPKAYLGYDESIGSKATLSQEDIRFSRTIARIQRTVIAELNKLAIIHLYSNGFDGDDLLDFTLQLPNPSTIAQQQKLDLYGTRFDIVSKAPEGYFDKRWLRKNLLGLTDEEIEEIEEGRVSDKLRELELEKVQAESEGGGMTQEPTDPTGGEIGSMPPPPPQPGGPPEGGGDIPMGGSPPEAPVGAGAGAGAGAGGEGPPAGGPAAPLDEIQFDYMKIGDEDSPLRAQRMIDRSVRKLEGLPVVLSEARRARSKKPGESKEEYDFWQQYNARRRKPGGNLRSSVDHNELTKHDKGDERDAITHPYGEKKDYSPSLKDLTPTIDESVQRDIDEVVNSYTTSMTNDINSALRSLRAGLPKTREDKE